MDAHVFTAYKQWLDAGNAEYVRTTLSGKELRLSKEQLEQGYETTDPYEFALLNEDPDIKRGVPTEQAAPAPTPPAPPVEQPAPVPAEQTSETSAPTPTEPTTTGEDAS